MKYIVTVTLYFIIWTYDGVSNRKVTEYPNIPWDTEYPMEYWDILLLFFKYLFKPVYKLHYFNN